MTKEEIRARKRIRLALALRDNWKLLAALKFYHRHLVPGEWIEVPRPCREKGRRLNPDWAHYLTASRRLLGVVARLMCDERGNILRDRKGRKRIQYRMRRPVWSLVQSRLGFRYDSRPPEAGHGRSLWLSESATKEIERQRLRREEEFDSMLENPMPELKFRNLPASFKITGELKNFSAEPGPVLLERAKTYLTHGIDPETQQFYAKDERRRREQLEEQMPTVEQQFREQLQRFLIQRTI